MKYKLLRVNGSWYFERVRIGSKCEDRLCRNIAFRYLDEPLDVNTPNYLVDRLVRKYQLVNCFSLIHSIELDLVHAIFIF